MIYMRRKPAFILMLVLGTMCLIDGPIKKDPKETLIGLAVTIYAIVTLVSDYRKKKAATQAQKPR